MPESTDSQESPDTSAPIDNPIVTLVGLLQSVVLDSPEAELNATSISDGRGGRIRL